MSVRNPGGGRVITAATVLLAVVLTSCGSDDGREKVAGAPAPSPDTPTCESLRAHRVVVGPLSDDTETAAAQQWRADIGFDSTIEAVETAREVATVKPEADVFPHPMTDAEADLLLGGGAAPAQLLWDYGQQHLNVFAGVWLDNVRSVATIGVTDDPARHEDALRDRYGGVLDDIRVVRMERTVADLDELQRKVESRLAGRFSGVGQHPDLNMVGVTIPAPDPETERLIAEFAANGGLCFDGYGVARAVAAVATAHPTDSIVADVVEDDDR